MDDLISRQAAIEVILDDKIGEKSLVIMRALGSENEAKSLNMACDRHVEFIKEIPSAQPEIIHCRKCKFASGDSRICMKFGHSPIGELDFCAWAERRTDEE